MNCPIEVTDPSIEDRRKHNLVSSSITPDHRFSSTPLSGLPRPSAFPIEDLQAKTTAATGFECSWILAGTIQTFRIHKTILKYEYRQRRNVQIDFFTVVRCSDVGSGPTMVKRLVEMFRRRPRYGLSLVCRCT